MGGRSGSSGMGGPSGKNIKIGDGQDVWSYRHDPDNDPFVNAINEGARKIQADFNDLMSETIIAINASEFLGKDKLETLGAYDYGNGILHMNTNYVDVEKMNVTYDKGVEQKFHPSRGNLTGTEAVALHELGHGLTVHVGKKMGAGDIDDAARRIFVAAYRASGAKGPYKEWAGQISGYARENYAESVAEAVSDYYCNGNNASAPARAIMREIMKYR